MVMMLAITLGYDSMQSLPLDSLKTHTDTYAQRYTYRDLVELCSLFRSG